LPLLAQPGKPEQIPPLRPPIGEIPPTFWEQHGLLVTVGGVVALVLIGIAVWFLTRPKPPSIVPPQVQAREALEPLRRQPENGVTLSRISQILKRYVAAAFDLEPGEATTAQFCQTLAHRPQISPNLAAALTEFLRRCDERKFAPDPPAVPLVAAERALELIEASEAERRKAEG
jgi:hypothetical protein